MSASKYPVDILPQRSFVFLKQYKVLEESSNSVKVFLTSHPPQSWPDRVLVLWYVFLFFLGCYLPNEPLCCVQEPTSRLHVTFLTLDTQQLLAGLCANANMVNWSGLNLRPAHCNHHYCYVSAVAIVILRREARHTQILPAICSFTVVSE